MRKKWTLQERNSLIKKWAEINNVNLLPETATFIGNKSAIYYVWSDGELQGLIGKTNFDSIISGSKPTVNGLTEESKNIRAKKRFLEYGLELLEEYQGFNTPHKVRVLDGVYAGYYGKTSLATVNQKSTRGKIAQLNITILTESEKRRYFREYAESRGYTIINYPEKLAVRGKCTLLSPQGNEWETVWYHFAYQENCNCPLDVKRSIGERMVRSLLKENGINFEEQKKIVIDGRTLFFDFYLPDDNTYIEYNGKQHYEDTGGYYKGKLQDLQERDKLKEQWCSQAGVNLVVIPYTANSINEVANVLSEIVPIKKRLVSVVYSDSIPNEDIIDYYKTHTGKETCRKYDLTQRRLSLLCNRVGFNKRRYLK
ncbi:hypothetical protein vBEfaHEF1TV_94 [Enterococcus phage vB_EfaH_EF1TV]|nr:hypothetical protein vBEfaHEF1TV_94 [Enterococcus phage vB_EfaH_EF1TV]